MRALCARIMSRLWLKTRSTGAEVVGTLNTLSSRGYRRLSDTSLRMNSYRLSLADCILTHSRYLLTALRTDVGSLITRGGFLWYEEKMQELGRLVKSVSASFSKDLSHEAKAKDSTLKAKAKTKDFKIILEDLSSRTPTLIIIHNSTVVWECCNDARSKSMEKAKIRPLATPKPLNRSSQKNDRRDYVLDGTRHAQFCSDRFRGLCSPNTWYWGAFCVTSFFNHFGVLHPWSNFYAKYAKRHRSDFRVRKCLLGAPLTIFNI